MNQEFASHVETHRTIEGAIPVWEQMSKQAERSWSGYGFKARRALGSKASLE